MEPSRVCVPERGRLTFLDCCLESVLDCCWFFDCAVFCLFFESVFSGMGYSTASERTMRSAGIHSSSRLLNSS